MDLAPVTIARRSRPTLGPDTHSITPSKNHRFIIPHHQSLSVRHWPAAGRKVVCRSCFFSSGLAWEWRTGLTDVKLEDKSSSPRFS